jgi:hypothetical protein
VESAQSEGARSAASAGYCVGAALATVLSWSSNHAIILAAPARAVVLAVRGVLRRNSLGTGEVLLATSPNAALSAGARYPIPRPIF